MLSKHSRNQQTS